MFGVNLNKDYWSEFITLIVRNRGGKVTIRRTMRTKGVSEMTFTHGTKNACGCTKVLANKMTWQKTNALA